MCGDDDVDNERVSSDDGTMDEHHIELTVTDLEWEIVNQALNAPIRSHILKRIREQGYMDEENIVESTWEELRERWEATW